MKNDIYEVLNGLNIEFEKVEHPAVFTTDQADHYQLGEGIGQSKNLFLRNKKKTNYYLVVMEADKKFDIKKFAELVDDSRMSFASPDDLMKYLQITPGSVSPFTLINNKENNVQVIIDQDLMNYEKAGFHPNDNTATLIITNNDLEKFLQTTGNNYQIIKL